MSLISSKKTTNWAFISIFMLVLVDSIGYGLIFPILSPLFMGNHGMVSSMASPGLRDFYYSLSLSLFAVFTFFASPFLGSLSDYYGRKPLLVMGLVGTAISSLICALGIYQRSLWLLFFGRSLSGITAGTQSIAQAAMVDITDPRYKTWYFSVISLAGSAGFTLGPIIGGYFSNSHIVGWFGYWTPFVVDGIMAFLNALILWLCFNPSQSKQPALTKAKFHLLQPLQLIGQGFKDFRINRLVYLNLCYQTGWTLYFQYIGIFLLQRFHFSSNQIGNFISFMTLCLAITNVFMLQYLLRFFSEKQLVSISLLVITVLTPIHLFTDALIWQYIIVMPLMIGVGLIWNCILTLASNAVSAEEQGWALGIIGGTNSFSWLIASILTGALDYLEPSLPFWCTALLALMGFFILSQKRKSAQ